MSDPDITSFPQLSEAVLVHLLGFLKQWHAGTLLQLSKGMREAIAPAIRALKLPRRPLDQTTREHEALGRLLGRLVNLRRLELHTLLTPTEQDGVMQALTDGAVGRQLEELHLELVNQTPGARQPEHVPPPLA